MSFTKLINFAAAISAAAFVITVVSGCQAMADPDGTDLPWAERPAWEYAPNIPGSMLER